MSNLENIFLSQISEEEQQVVKENIDLLSVFEQYIIEDVEGALNVLKNYEGILKFAPNQIETNVKKFAAGVESGVGIDRMIKIFKKINNYKSITEASDKMILFLICMYLYGIEKNFNSSAAGFLFESFISGLTAGEVVGTRELEDIKIGSEYYSVKFLASNSKITGSLKNFEKLKSDNKTIGLIIGKKKGNAVEIVIIDPKSFTKKLNEELKVKKEGQTQFSFSQDEIKPTETILVHVEDVLQYFENAVFPAISSVMKLSTQIVNNLTTYLSIFKDGKQANQTKILTAAIVDRSKELSKESKKLESK